MKNKLIVVDDDIYTLRFVKRILMREKIYSVDTADNGKDVLNLLRKGTFNYDIAIIDQRLPDISGIELIKAIKSRKLKTECVMLTAVDDVEIAVAAIKLGAYDYIKKPVDPSKLVITLAHIIERKNLIGEIEDLKGRTFKIENKDAFKSVITESKKMFEIFRQMEIACNSKGPVLITGESGVGKTLLGECFKKLCPDRKKFIKIDIPSYRKVDLIDMFFRNKNEKNLFSQAKGGIIFLDEIGDIDLSLQSRLLRVLESGEYLIEGDLKPKKADCKFIFSTNKNLFELMEKGHFRKDFYFRISAQIITVPPLRERIDDIGLLTDYFLKKYTEKSQKKIKSVSEDVKVLLKKYNFPGNIRELENIVRSAIAVETKDTIRKSSLPEYILKYFTETEKEKILTLAEVERNYILKVLESVNFNKTKASKLLGITRPTLLNKLKEYGFSR